jgi:hypothetical protein
MIDGVAQRVSSPVLVGRDAEVGQLRAALQRAAAGQPAIVVVAGEAGVVAYRRVGAVQSAEVGAEQPDRANFAGADGLEPVAEENNLVDLEAVGVQGGAGVVAYGRVGAVQSAEVAAGQPDCTGLAVSRDHRPIKSQHGSGEPVGVQRRLGGMLDSAPGQDERRQRRVAGDQALAEQAVVELHGDAGGQVLQVELAGDAGAPQPQPVGVRIWGQPAAQDSRSTAARTVRELPQERMAASSTGSAAARSSSSPRLTWSTSACSTSVNDASPAVSVTMPSR